jgi:hypothetical protein
MSYNLLIIEIRKNDLCHYLPDMCCPNNVSYTDCSVIIHGGYNKIYIICQIALVTERKLLFGLPNVEQQLQLRTIYFHA